MTPGSSTVAIRRKRPPQRGHASTSISNARRISAAHAQNFQSLGFYTRGDLDWIAAAPDAF
jgi:hypothetical protein